MNAPDIAKHIVSLFEANPQDASDAAQLIKPGMSQARIDKILNAHSIDTKTKLLDKFVGAITKNRIQALNPQDITNPTAALEKADESMETSPGLKADAGKLAAKIGKKDLAKQTEEEVDGSGDDDSGDPLEDAFEDVADLGPEAVL